MLRRLIFSVALISGLSAQSRLQLKNGPSQLSALFSAQPAHVLIATSPDTPAGFMDLLAQRGAWIVRTLPMDHYLISVPAGVDLSDLQLASALQLDASLKVSAALNADGFYVVEFHPDISLGDATSLLISNGFVIHSRPDMAPSHVLVEGTLAGAWKLAQNDQVAYVFAASDDLIQGNPVYACASAVTTVGGIGQYIATYGDGWDGPGNGSAALTYSFQVLTTKLPQAQVIAQFQRVFDEWKKAASVTFAQVSQTDALRNINILFASASHGDPYPFDGPGGVLAHTFFPSPPNPEPLAGDMHLDADENWQVGADIDIFSVALHEMGHALGLGHSDNPAAVMYPYYKRANQLMADDIATVQTLYAAPSSVSSGTPPIPGSPGTVAPGFTPPPIPGSPAPSAPVTPEAPAGPPGPVTITTLAAVNASAATVDLTGTASGGFGSLVVSWSTDRGQSGLADGIATWRISGLTVPSGVTHVTITATDSVQISTSITVVVTGAGSSGLPGNPAPIPTPSPVPVPSPLQLTISSPGHSIVALAQVTLAGSASYAAGIQRVHWSNSTGGSGDATGTTSWSAQISLQNGDNTISVTATGNDGTQASQSVMVTYALAASADTTPPSLTIYSPATTLVATNGATIIVKGLAVDNVGVTEVSWTTAGGGSGLATGTAYWSTAPIPLLNGDNTITIRAKDAAGNVGWRAITVTRN